MDIEQWLAANTFTCRALSARITPVQCALNREGTPDEEDLVVMIPACRVCTEWPVASVQPVAEPVAGPGAGPADRAECGPAPQGQGADPDLPARIIPGGAGRSGLAARFRATALATPAGFVFTAAAVRRFALGRYRAATLEEDGDGTCLARFLRKSPRGRVPGVHPLRPFQDGVRLAAPEFVAASGAFGRYELEGEAGPELALTLIPPGLA